MPVEDFLITFRADTSGALAAINAFATRVEQVNTALNTAMAGLGSASGSPLSGLAAGAPQAAAGINRINKSLLQMGQNVKLDSEQVDALLVRLRSLQTDLARTTRGGRGFAANQGQVTEAIRIIQQLRDAHHLSADEARKWSDEIAAAYAKVANVPQGLRNLPLAEQTRIVGLREQAIRQERALGQARQPFGGVQNIRAHENALTNYIRTLRELGVHSTATAQQLDALERELNQVRAAASLQSQRTGALRTTEGLRNRAADLRAQLAGGGLTGGREITALRQLERSLFQLEQRGDPVQAELDQTRIKIEQLAAAALRAKSVDQLLARRGTLDERLSSRQERGQDTRSILQAQLRNETALRSLGDPAAASRLRAFSQQFAALPPIIDASTRRMIEFNRATRERVLLGERLNLKSVSPETLTRGLSNAIKLQGQGFIDAADDVDFFGQRVANLPPTLDRLAQGMLTHSRRVAEGLVIYEAFGRAMSALGQQIELVNTLAREQIRFTQVAGGLGEGGGSQFLVNLQDIAVRTNTDMGELASQLDTVAASMLDLGSASQIAASSQEFLNDAGQFTNITQRDLASETQNLLGIFNQTGDSVGAFSDRLGRIVVAGRNSSTIIAGVTDVLSEAGRSARATGFDFDFLASLGGQLTEELIGTMSGSEIGGMLNTIIGRLTDPEVINRITELSNGVIAFSDASGRLRPTHEILIDIFSAIESGLIDAKEAPKVLDQIVPPLNPAARAFVSTLQRNIPEALADMGRIMQGTSEDAKNLSDTLVSGPGERFAASIKEIQGALAGIFSEQVIGLGNSFAESIKVLAKLLGSGQAGGGLSGGIIGLTAKVLLLAAGFRTLQFVFRNVSLMIFGSGGRIREIQAAFLGASAATATNTAAVGANSAAVSANTARQILMGTAVQGAAARGITAAATWRGVTAALTGTLAIAKSLLPVLALLAAADLPDSFGDIFSGEDIKNAAIERSRLNAEALTRAFQVSGTPEFAKFAAQGASLTGFNLLSGEEDLTANQFGNVVALAEAMIDLQKQGKFTADTQKLLEDQILGTNGRIKEQSISVDELLLGLSETSTETKEAADATAFYETQAREAAEAAQAMADAEERSNRALSINAGLSVTRATQFADLARQLREGTISLEDWETAQTNVGRASEAAAQFLATYGDNLSLFPGLQERIAATGEDAATALFNLLSSNPDTLGQQIEIIEQMVALADANQEVAKVLRENPITPIVKSEEYTAGTEVVIQSSSRMLEGVEITQRTLNNNPIKPQIDIDGFRAQVGKYIQLASTIIGTNNVIGLSLNALGTAFQLSKVGTAMQKGGGGAALPTGISDELQSLEEALRALQVAESEGRAKDAAAGPSQTGIIDLGDLSPSAIQQIVAIASAAQQKIIAAGGTVDTDDTTAFFKDAAFQQLIKGVDQSLLRQALEELTEVERRRLELEQQRLQDVTRELVTRVGPIQSIVSAPVLSAGGGVLSGQGLNADPRLGNITINVPVNWSGMDLAQLQRFIYESIQKAWIDAGRGA